MRLDTSPEPDAAAKRPDRTGPSAPGGELARLRDEIARLAALNAALQAELAEARLAQQQLQSYADDFRQTYAESRRRLHQMTVLYEVSAAIAGTVDPAEVLARTTEGLRRLLPNDSAAVYVLEDDGRLARRQAALFLPGTPEPPETVAPGDGSLGRCLATGETVIEDAPTVASAASTARTLALPLVAGQRGLGALLLLRLGEPPYADEERRLALMVASQAAMALQNARLVVTDGLTSLYNRRYFEQALALECERAGRSGRPVGLLIADVDHFKRFNDTFGHLAGDAVLRDVAATLVYALRRTDVVARIGGEEFAAILPEDDRPAVAAAAERVRLAIERRPRLVFEGVELPSVRVSVGAASLPPEALTPRALIGLADAALQQAKRAGRNRSMVAGGEPTGLGPS